MSDPADLNNAAVLSALANPYDFARPVTRADRFAGRESELADIRYYLTLAKQTPEPMNLALIGERASGKTSMLNIIDIEARKTGLITARINLNTADAEPISFFWKLYDALIDAYSTAGYLFKPGSDEDVVYRRIIDSLDLSADSPNFPLRFPGHYALAVTGSRQISEVKLQRDLAYIYERTNTPCVLIFDECNVLTQNRVTLEMLRNIFMNISGYMIVLTGTPSFFPLLDDVFSPIIRQFKKVNIRAFASIDETRQCVYNPLRSLALNPAVLVPGRALFDIHEISLGRPYEVQLLCHFMFRRLQDQRADKMKLTADVLDDVVNELEANISGSVERPIVVAARNMTREQLATVNVFGRADGHANIDLAWFMSAISSSSEEHYTRDELGRLLDELKTLGVFQVGEDGNIQFAGDDFDRIYLRYHAERLGLTVVIEDYLTEIALAVLLETALRNIGMNTTVEFPPQPSLEKAVNALLNSPIGELPEIALAAVKPVVVAMDHGRLAIAGVTISYGNEHARSWIWWPFKTEYSMADDPGYLALKETIESHGGSLSMESSIFAMPSENEFITRVLSSSNVRLKRRIGEVFVGQATDEYVAARDDTALTQARRARLFPLQAAALNNVGYIYMALGHWSDAETILHQAIVKAEEEKDYRTWSLAEYNSAMCMLSNLHREDAVAALAQARQKLSAYRDGTYQLQCLLVPIVDGESLALKEMWEPELSLSIEAATAAIEAAPNLGAVDIIRRELQ